MSSAEKAPTQFERRKQVINFSYWAIAEILDDTYKFAMAELLDNQRTGKDLSRPAARLAVIDELRLTFEAHLTKEKQDA